MGNSNPTSKAKRPSHSSVQSPRLHLPCFAKKEKSVSYQSNSAISPGRHFVNTSADFNQSSSELKANLPENLKVYSNSIEVMYRFWCSEIEGLSADKFRETCVLFYMNAFQKIPAARQFFAKNIESQAKRFFGMFRWLIANLKQPDPGRLIQSIKVLGTMHQKMGINPEWYYLFLEAFHATMVEIMKQKYTPRTRFCMEQMYTLVSNIMLGNDFASLSSAKISQFLKSLGSLEDCLHDAQGRQYLEMYMRQQLCVEHLLFYNEYRAFKACVNKHQRKSIGTKIVNNYLDDGAQCEINVSYDCKMNVYRTVGANKGAFNENIFDECGRETMKLMQHNIWSGFKESIFKMAVDADINYEANASISTQSLKQSVEADINYESVECHQVSR